MTQNQSQNTKDLVDFEISKEIILKNAAQCNSCFDVLESTHRWDYKECRCKSISVDGGRDYLRRVYDGRGYVELSLQSKKISEIREAFTWTSFGKHGEFPQGVKKPIKELSDEHIAAILSTQPHIAGTTTEEVFLTEQKYREANNIKIGEDSDEVITNSISDESLEDEEDEFECDENEGCNCPYCTGLPKKNNAHHRTHEEVEVDFSKQSIKLRYGKGYFAPIIGNVAAKLKDTGNCVKVKFFCNGELEQKVTLDYSQLDYMRKLLNSWYENFELYKDEGDE